jgi:hypothetical protein
MVGTGRFELPTPRTPSEPGCGLWFVFLRVQVAAEWIRGVFVRVPSQLPHTTCTLQLGELGFGDEVRDEHQNRIESPVYFVSKVCLIVAGSK